MKRRHAWIGLLHPCLETVLKTGEQNETCYWSNRHTLPARYRVFDSSPRTGQYRQRSRAAGGGSLEQDGGLSSIPPRVRDPVDVDVRSGSHQRVESATGQEGDP